MEEKKPFDLRIDCSLCVNCPTCQHVKDGLCRMFTPSEASFSIKVGDYLNKNTTEGFTLRQVTEVAARSEKPCIMFRKKWGDDKFVWIVGFLKVDDPWGRESHRRTKEAGYTLFKEGDEDTPILACWDRYAKCVYPGVIFYTPDDDDRSASDWCYKVIPGEKKNTDGKAGNEKSAEGKTGFSCCGGENHAESEFGPLMELLKMLARGSGPIKSGILVTNCDGGTRDLFEALRGLTEQRIMDGLDELLK